MLLKKGDIVLVPFPYLVFYGLILHDKFCRINVPTLGVLINPLFRYDANELTPTFVAS